MSISPDIVALFEARMSGKDIAAKLGLDPREVKRLRKEWKGEPSRTPTRAREEPEDDERIDLKGPAQERVEMTFVEWAEDAAIQTEMVVAKLMWDLENGGKVNAAGLAAMFTRKREARDKLEIIRATIGGAARTQEEIRAQTLLSLEEWPDDLLEMAFGVYSERHKGRVLFVSGNGEHRAEYDAEAESWVREA